MSSEILSALWQSAAQQQFPTHALYLVATPIGNQADISIRALAVLSKVDAIACEDTRHSKTLLNQYGIQKPLIAAHEHNENAAAQQIIERLQRGERIALITDAGTPAISDPGARVVAHARAAGLRVVPIPGASAVVTVRVSPASMADTAPRLASRHTASTMGRARLRNFMVLVSFPRAPWAAVLYRMRRYHCKLVPEKRMTIL